jgi:hypothetical protein
LHIGKIGHLASRMDYTNASSDGKMGILHDTLKFVKTALCKRFYKL